jgi:hypothetical protein
MDIQAEKDAIRKQVFAGRLDIDPTEKAVWDAAVANRILSLLPDGSLISKSAGSAFPSRG